MEQTQKNNGCFMTSAELEYLRDRFVQDRDLSRIFNHIDALESLIQEISQKYENEVSQAADDWADVGEYMQEAEQNNLEILAHGEALKDRITELERIRDINKSETITMTDEVFRLMRKIPFGNR